MTVFGMPSSSLAGIPPEGLRWNPGRRLFAPSGPWGTVLGSAGDRTWTGGENGIGLGPTMLAELALRARSFSARSARKKISSGDSCRVISVDRRRCCGVGAASESVAGGDGSRLAWSVPRTEGESRALDRKLGIGREEGAGDAWKVAPAKAAAGIALGIVEWGGVVRPCFAGPGDETCFVRLFPFPFPFPFPLPLAFPFRGLDLAWLGCVEGAGLLAADFCGVNGPASSIGKSASLGTSFSEAYVLRAGELTGRFGRRRAGVLFWGGNGGGCSMFVEKEEEAA
jgi:hypothetical protein